jgi:hypothetical protein
LSYALSFVFVPKVLLARASHVPKYVRKAQVAVFLGSLARAAIIGLKAWFCKAVMEMKEAISMRIKKAEQTSESFTAPLMLSTV